VATQVMNLIFIVPFQHAGLALAIGLGACLNAGMLYQRLRQHGIYTPQPGWVVFALKIALAIMVMLLCLWLAAGNADVWLTAGAIARVLRLAGVVIFGAAAYFATLWLLGFRLRDFTLRAA